MSFDFLTTQTTTKGLQDASFLFELLEFTSNKKGYAAAVRELSDKANAVAESIKECAKAEAERAKNDKASLAILQSANRAEEKVKLEKKELAKSLALLRVKEKELVAKEQALNEKDAKIVQRAQALEPFKASLLKKEVELDRSIAAAKSNEAKYAEILGNIKQMAG